MLVSDLIAEISDKKEVFGLTNETAVVFCPADKPTLGGVTFLTKKHAEKIQTLLRFKVALVLVEETPEGLELGNTALVLVSNARKSFANLLLKIPTLYPTPESSGTIAQSSEIHIYSQISNSVEIGPETQIGFGCSIINGTKIGSRTKIGANTSIGGDGFGYILESDSLPFKFPHVSNVVIGDDVEIGSNVCIDRGALSPTIISSGVKIDNLVHIAHNVEIGKNSLIIAKSVLCGSVKIGENVWIAPGSIILEGVNVGSNSIVGVGSIVLKDVEPNSLVIGNPARKIRDV